MKNVTFIVFLIYAGQEMFVYSVLVTAHWDEQFVLLQWAVVGDTFPVGCKFQNSIVLRNSTFTDNPDEKNPAYKYVVPC